MRVLLAILLFSVSFSSFASKMDVDHSVENTAQAWTIDMPEELLGVYVGQIEHSVLGQQIVHFALIKSAFKGKVYASFSVGDGRHLALYMNEVYHNPHTQQLLARIEFPAKKDFGVIFNEIVIDLESNTQISGTYQANSFSAGGRILEGTWTARKVD